MRLKDSKFTNLDEFSLPILWQGNLSHSYGLNIDEQDNVVKLLFLDNIFQVNKGAPAFDDIFLDYSLTVTYFESLWNLQRMESENYVEFALADSMDAGTINKITNTGDSKVDVWFKAYREAN